MEVTMDEEKRTKIIIYILLVFIVAGLAVHCSNVLRHSGAIFTNPGHSEWVYRARYYFLVLMGIAVIITQNVFIRKALKRIEQKKNSQHED
jgi:hypothetical protein